MNKRDKRKFSDAEKIKIVEKVLAGQLPITKVLDENGELIHYPNIRNWITQYKAGELGTKYKERFERRRDSQTAGNPQLTEITDEKEMLDIMKFMFNLMEHIIQLYGEIDQLKLGNVPTDPIPKTAPSLTDLTKKYNSILAQRMKNR